MSVKRHGRMECGGLTLVEEEDGAREVGVIGRPGDVEVVEHGWQLLLM